MGARWTGLFVVACVLSGAACSNGLGFAVTTSLVFDGTVSDDALQRVTQLRIAGSGDETYGRTFAVGRAAQRTERVVYRPAAATRKLALEVDALDAADVVVAHGTSGEIALQAGETRTLEITLSGGDLGGDLAGADLTGADLAGVDQAFVCAAGDFCDDFEGALADNWSQFPIMATMASDTTRPHHGAKAYHATFPRGEIGATQAGQLAHKQDWFVLYPDGWARVYVYMGSEAWHNQLELISVQQTDSPGGTITMLMDVDQKLVLSNGVSSSRKTVKTSAILPRDRWVCVELHFALGMQAGVTKVALDGVDVPETLVSNTQATPVLGRFLLAPGVYGLNAAEPATREIWFDDLVLSAQRVGCSD